MKHRPMCTERTLYTLSLMGFATKLAYPALLKVTKRVKDHLTGSREGPGLTFLDHPALNLEFLLNLRKLVGIILPGVWTKEFGLLGAHTLTLVARYGHNQV